MGRKVLVVDDDPVIRALLGDYVAKFGHNVEVQASGADCLQSIAQSQPDIIVLDLQMPDMSGAEVLAKLRADPKTAHLPIIMLSANENSSSVGSQEIHADRYMQKPFNMKEILGAIEDTILVRNQ